MIFKNYTFESKEVKKEIKEAIEHILKTYGVEPTKEAIDNYDIEKINKIHAPIPTDEYLKKLMKIDDEYSEFFDDFLSSWGSFLDENKEEELEKNEYKIMTPKEIVSRLNEKVIGQDEVKRVLSIEIYKHLLKIENPDSMKDVNKNNILFCGDSGTGKTFLCETVCHFIGLPYEIIDASILSDTGFIGASITDFLERLYKKTNGNIEVAEKAIIVIDEIDKLIDSPNSSKNSNKDVANELLKIIEGAEFSIKIGLEQKTINTSNMLFIGCGAFDKIENIISDRLKIDNNFKKNKIGFKVAQDDKEDHKELSNNELRAKIEREDFINYGLMRELIGRFHTISLLNPLNENDFINILKNKNGGIIKEYIDLFETIGKKLIIKNDTYKFIAEKSMKEKTGARALRGTFAKVMEDYIFNAPSEKRKTYTINKEYCKKVLEH